MTGDAFKLRRELKKRGGFRLTRERRPTAS